MRYAIRWFKCKLKPPKNWSCSGEWEYDDGSIEPCSQICSDQFAWWKHFCTLHQGTYLYYCNIDGCDYGSDQKTEIPKHKLQKHKKKLQEDDPMIVCNNFKKVFGQKGKYEMHAKICGKPASRPFACGECVKTFRDRDQLRIHTKQDHQQKKGIAVDFTSATNVERSIDRSQQPGAI